MSFLLRTTNLVRQRLFTTSSRARTAISVQDAAAAHMAATPGASVVPRLGRVARWYLPTMAMVAIGFGVTNALNDANRRVHSARELTQEQKNQMLMDAYGERSSLADMERAMAGLEARAAAPKKSRNQILEEAYGDKTSIADLQRAMEIYEVQ
ncbi:uncharacterized protein SETTUDRAFT_22313 [Exserohilum turcica Et28A]|uniref:Uncharacterized protein n=1 Tax=Exserohilum turcicum (strain 28A) TaxID=671987 RepID=R0K5M9_EXST2|nr:uncharacterized protein SETTUDRAFT_22313 [Exserohilum turcica Et28A]EOA83617.1 hypothetical protein SETTUDRAFT_22313 [Exserohilum turcica Et28A]